MQRQSRVMAVCGMMTALGVVLMLLGHVLGLGLYAAPMLVGLALVPIGNRYGRKYHVLMWLAIGILSALIGVNAAQTPFFALFFGLYPILRPFFMRLPKLLRVIAKLGYCNAVAIAIELLVLYVIAPEAIGLPLLLLLLALGNLLFFCFDFVIPYTELLLRNLQKRIRRLLS